MLRAIRVLAAFESEGGGKEGGESDFGNAWIDEGPGENLSRSCGVGPDPLTLQSRRKGSWKL